MKSILTVIIALSFLGCSEQPVAPNSPLSLPVMELSSGSANTYQEYPASIEGIADVEIRPQVSGILEKLYIEEGAFVKAGMALFKINEGPYREKLNNTKANLLAAIGAQTHAVIEVDKLKPLVLNNVVADYQLKTAQTTLEIAQANVIQAKADIASAQINLGYTLIRAPVNGYIGRLRKKKGSIIGPSDTEPLTQLSDVRNIHVYFSLAERDFSDFKEQYPGATLEDKIKKLPPVSLRLSDNKFYDRPGRIDIIDGQFDKNTGAITVRASFSNPKGLIRSGNTGRILLALQHTDALLIPQSATFEMQDKTFVFIVGQGNVVKRQPIVINGITADNYIISDGLKAGDRIVLDGLGTLQEGTVINPVKAPVKVAGTITKQNK